MTSDQWHDIIKDAVAALFYFGLAFLIFRSMRNN